MARFTFRCPDTGLMVQGTAEESVSPDNGKTRYAGVQCLACRRLHFVNPRTGKLLSEEIDQPD